MTMNEKALIKADMWSDKALFVYNRIKKDGCNDWLCDEMTEKQFLFLVREAGMPAHYINILNKGISALLIGYTLCGCGTSIDMIKNLEKF